jgi:hypothetical protein
MAVYFRFVYKSLESLDKTKAEVFWNVLHPQHDVALTDPEAS